MYALNNSCVPPVKPQHRHVVSLSHVKRRSMLTIFKNDHFAFGVQLQDSAYDSIPVLSSFPFLTLCGFVLFALFSVSAGSVELLSLQTLSFLLLSLQKLVVFYGMQYNINDLLFLFLFPCNELLMYPRPLAKNRWWKLFFTGINCVECNIMSISACI